MPESKEKAVGEKSTRGATSQDEKGARKKKSAISRITSPKGATGEYGEESLETIHTDTDEEEESSESSSSEENTKTKKKKKNKTKKTEIKALPYQGKQRASGTVGRVICEARTGAHRSAMCLPHDAFHAISPIQRLRRSSRRGQRQRQRQ